MSKYPGYRLNCFKFVPYADATSLNLKFKDKYSEITYSFVQHAPGRLSGLVPEDDTSYPLCRSLAKISGMHETVHQPRRIQQLLGSCWLGWAAGGVLAAVKVFRQSASAFFFSSSSENVTMGEMWERSFMSLVLTWMAPALLVCKIYLPSIIWMKRWNMQDFIIRNHYWLLPSPSPSS